MPVDIRSVMNAMSGPGMPNARPGMNRMAGAGRNHPMGAAQPSPNYGTQPAGPVGYGDPALAQAGNLIASLGRGGDTRIAHLTEGEYVIPRNILDTQPKLMASIIDAFGRHNRTTGDRADWRRYIVNGGNNMNPATGQREFRFGPQEHLGPRVANQSFADNIRLDRRVVELLATGEAPSIGEWEVLALHAPYASNQAMYKQVLMRGAGDGETNSYYPFEQMVQRLNFATTAATPHAPSINPQTGLQEFKAAGLGADRSGAGSVGGGGGGDFTRDTPFGGASQQGRTDLSGVGQGGGPTTLGTGGGLSSMATGGSTIGDPSSPSLGGHPPAPGPEIAGLGGSTSSPSVGGFFDSLVPDFNSQTFAPSALAGMMVPGAGQFFSGMESFRDWAESEGWDVRDASQGAFNALAEGRADVGERMQDRAIAQFSPAVQESINEASRFTPPEPMTPPGHLGLSGAMSPLQQRAAIATGATQGSSVYRSPEAEGYYKNLLQRALVGPGGEMGDYGQVLPIEQQYLRSILGLSYQPTTQSLLEAIASA